MDFAPASADRGAGDGRNQLCIDTNSFVVGQYFDKCEVVEDEVPHGAIIPISKKNLTEGQRRAVYVYLLTRSVDGRLRCGVVKAASEVFGVSTRTINRVWTRGRELLANGNVFADVSSPMFGKKVRARVDIDIGKYKMIGIFAQRHVQLMYPNRLSIVASPKESSNAIRMR